MLRVTINDPYIFVSQNSKAVRKDKFFSSQRRLQSVSAGLQQLYDEAESRSPEDIIVM